MKRIVFIVETKFQNRDAKRFGIEFFKGKGFEPVIWDISWIINPTYAREYCAPDLYEGNVFEFKDMKSFLQECSKLCFADLVLKTRARGKKYHKIEKALIGSPATYGQFDFGIQPGQNIILNKGNVGKSLSRIRNVLKNPWQLPELIYNKIPKRIRGVGNLDFLILGGGTDIALRNHEVSQDLTKWIWSHTLDYDIFLDNGPDVDSTDENYILYLDSYMCFHPSLKIREIEPFIDVERFFSRLRMCFEYLEQRFGAKVLIAAHPRSEYETMNQDFFDGRKLVKGNTVEWVKRAKLVLSHSSNSTVFAALYKKPVLFLTNDDIESDCSPYVGYSKEYAKSLGRVCHNFDQDINVLDDQDILSVDEVDYDDFVERYVKTSGSPAKPFWEIFYDAYSKGF